MKKTKRKLDFKVGQTIVFLDDRNSITGYKKGDTALITKTDPEDSTGLYYQVDDSVWLYEDEFELQKISEVVRQAQKEGAEKLMDAMSEHLESNDLHAEICTSDIELSINRQGEFEVDPEQFHQSQCGTNKKRDYKYEVSIMAMNNTLSKPDMFVMDNMDVEKYFQDTYVTNKNVCYSCEVMAVRAVNHFRKVFKEIYPEVDVRKIHVVIRGSGVSFITGTWIKK